MSESTDRDLYQPDGLHTSVAVADGTTYSTDATGKLSNPDARHVDELRRHGFLTERPGPGRDDAASASASASAKKGATASG